MIPMGEIRTPKRVPPGARRRGDQGRLAMTAADVDAAGDERRVQAIGRADGFRRPVRRPGVSPAPDPPKSPTPTLPSLAYRQVVAEWLFEDREDWGRRANELEGAGLPWRDAEIQAFVEVWLHLHRYDAAAGADEVEDDLP
jgi:hypothetical protein